MCCTLVKLRDGWKLQVKNIKIPSSGKQRVTRLWLNIQSTIIITLTMMWRRYRQKRMNKGNLLCMKCPIHRYCYKGKTAINLRSNVENLSATYLTGWSMQCSIILLRWFKIELVYEIMSAYCWGWLLMHMRNFRQVCTSVAGAPRPRWTQRFSTKCLISLYRFYIPLVSAFVFSYHFEITR